MKVKAIMQTISLYMLLLGLGNLIVCGCTWENSQAIDSKKEKDSPITQISDPNALNKEGSPIIFNAIERMDLAGVKRLIEAGADIEKQGFGEQTPALRAASARQWNICLYLLEQGANPIVTDHSGLNIPYLALDPGIEHIFKSQIEGLKAVRKYLIKHNLDSLNIPPWRVRELKAAGNWPPKEIPAHKKTNDPNALNRGGEPIIFDAIKRGDFAEVKRLVKAGADIRKRGFDKETTVLRAASYGRWDICLYLLKLGVDPSLTNHFDQTISYIAFLNRGRFVEPHLRRGRWFESGQKNLDAVRNYLIKHNLSYLNIRPQRVQKLKATGNWPPKGDVQQK